MALTWYRVNVQSVQLPDGTAAVLNEKVRVESTNAAIAAFVAANVLVATTDMSAVTPPLAATAVISGRAKPPMIRDRMAETVHNAVDTNQVKTYVDPLTLSIPAGASAAAITSE